MRHAAGIGLRWIGRLLVLAAPFVLVCSLFFPDGVQFLNPVACPDGLSLDNGRYTGPGQPADERLEIVCTGPDATVSAAREILLTVATLVTLGLIALYFSKSLLTGAYRAPVTPSSR